jgi:hypothetical protein
LADVQPLGLGDPNANSHLSTLVCELHGVGQEVQEDLLEPIFIANDMVQELEVAFSVINFGSYFTSVFDEF